MKRLWFAAVLLLAACSGGPFLPIDPPTTDVTVRSRLDGYILLPGQQPSATIVFDVGNHLSVPVSLTRCGDFLGAELQRVEDGRWITVYAGYCVTAAPLVYDPYPLGPGTVAQGQMTVSGMTGTFRLRLPYAYQTEAGSYAVSPPFTIRESVI
jgi:hypothetical protein